MKICVDKSLYIVYIVHVLQSVCGQEDDEEYRETEEFCPCEGRIHPQERYCASDFAVRAFVQGKKNNGFFSQYKMKVQTVFKGSRNYRSLKRMKKRIFFTPSNPLHCGIHISSKKHYIISGIAEKNLPFSDSCMYIADWPETVEERRALGEVLQSYSRNCECRIITCDYEPCDKHPDVCLYFPEDPAIDCFNKHTICSRNRDGHCQWVSNTQFENCIREYTNEGLRDT